MHAMEDLKRNSNRKIANYKATGTVEYDEYYPKLSAALIHDIDTILLKLYDLNKSEINFLIDYDSKFRVSDND